MGLFGGGNKSSSSTTNKVSTIGVSDNAAATYIDGSDNTIIDPGAFSLARLTVEKSGENFDTAVGFAEQIEANRAKETEGYRDQLANNASEAIQRTAAGIQTAFETANGAIDPIKVFAGVFILGLVAIWRFSE